MSKNIYDKIRSHPLYREAFEAFNSGDKTKGMDLMYKLQKEQELIEEISNHRTFDPTSVGVVMISKDKPIPDGYCRNTFSDKTCITTQQKDLPEWREIVAVVEYDGKEVYEDHYSMEFTEKNMLFGIKKDNPKKFQGRIITHSNKKHSLDKFMKNSLHRIIDELYIELSDVTYTADEILNMFVNHEHLRDVVVKHTGRAYTPEEIKTVKAIFSLTKWYNLRFESDNAKFYLSR